MLKSFMKFLDSSKISSITQLEQIALRKSSNSKYIQHFSERGCHSELSKSRLSVMDRRLFFIVFSPISLKSLKNC